jgi:hypothetical protein
MGIQASATRDQWMIPLLSLMGYELTYISRAAEVDGQTYAISHRAGHDENAPPVHIVGCRQSLDRRPESGRPRLAPHSLLQEYINRTEHLWGVVTNGYTLRLLRDSQLIRRQAYIEFDIKQMMESEKFSDFALLFRLVHRSRLPLGMEDASESLLEKYYKITVEQGGRVRDRLRDGVEEALKILANGFLHHQRNEELRERIKEGKLSPHSFYQQLLRLIYRFLFLMVAEERNLITENPDYRDHYSISRLRKLAELRSSYSEHEDLWLGLQTTFRLFQDERLSEIFGVPPLNGDLFNTSQTQDLQGISISNREFLTALWKLSMYREDEKTPWRRINYAALDVEELGSVYESLLDFQPIFHGLGASGEGRVANSEGKGLRTSITFALAYGTERKSTGSYYTPPELVNELIKSALVPVMEERLEEAKRMASGEWRMVQGPYRKEFIHYASQKLHRTGSLATGPGNCKGSISSDENVPEGGTLRDDIPDSAGSDFDAGQHSRGVGQTLPSGVHSVLTEGQRQPDGIGDTSDRERGRWALYGEGHPATVTGDRHSGQTTTRPGTETETKKGEWRIANSITHPFVSSDEVDRLWRSTPFTIRYSLLAEQALLALKVCDPASGSGHFLLAAARRLGRELAKIRTGDDEPAPEQMRLAIRDVITHSIYAVDKNPLAVDLCKVALWMEGHAKGKPLTFLDHRIRCGDSLIGVFDLNVLKEGIPDEAFDPVSGDDKATARMLKKRNRDERSGQPSLPLVTSEELKKLGEDRRPLLELPDDTPEQIRQKVNAYQNLQRQGTKWWYDQTACHLWTSAFFTELTAENDKNRRIPTTDNLYRYLETHNLDGRLIGNTWALAQNHKFFHWPLEFPEVFSPFAIHDSPLTAVGFDVILCNPPWERIKLQEQEFFASKELEIANAPNKSARQRLIQQLPQTNPTLWREYKQALHDADAQSKFLRQSGRFKLTARGDINTYSVFAELFTNLINPSGRVGVVIPTGIATDDTNKFFFSHLVENKRLTSLYDFENREKLFPAVDSRYKFSLLTIRGTRDAYIEPAKFAFFLTNVTQLRDEQRIFTLTADDFNRLNPNTRTCPVFRTKGDAELTKKIYERVPVLVNEKTGENPWGVRFMTMFHMSNDSHLFRTRDQLEEKGFRLIGNRFVKDNEVWHPLYEAKMIWHFDHRFGTYDNVSDRSSTHLPTPAANQYADPNFIAQPWYWVSRQEVTYRISNVPKALIDAYKANNPNLVLQVLAIWLAGYHLNKGNENVGNFLLAKAYNPIFRSIPESIGDWLSAKGLERKFPITDEDINLIKKHDDVIEMVTELIERHCPKWLLGFRDVTNATNERTAIFCILPEAGVGNNTPIMLFDIRTTYRVLCLVSNLNSFVFDYVVRQKISGMHMNFFFVTQLPVLKIGAYADPDLILIVPQVLELLYVSWDTKPFADDVWRDADDMLKAEIKKQWEENRTATGGHEWNPPEWAEIAEDGIPLPPFKWDENRRAVLRAELDAYYAKLYGLTRKQLRYILDPAGLTEKELKDILDPWEEVKDPLDPEDYARRVEKSTFPGETFRVLKEKEIRQYREYRTRRLVLEAWEALVGQS